MNPQMLYTISALPARIMIVISAFKRASLSYLLILSNVYPAMNLIFISFVRRKAFFHQKISLRRRNSLHAKEGTVFPAPSEG
jgi:hypothetical protein